MMLEVHEAGPEPAGLISPRGFRATTPPLVRLKKVVVRAFFFVCRRSC